MAKANTAKVKTPEVLKADTPETASTKLARRGPVAIARRPNDNAEIVLRLIDLAKDPAIDALKINQLLDAHERVSAHQARAAFDAAFAQMQAELPVIQKNGRIMVEGALRSTFARDVDIMSVVRPILAKHGFALRHSNSMKDGLLTVTGILSHRDGHRETDLFETARDDSGRKNPIQSWGSARQYGKRYTTISLLNISSEDEDDGESTGKAVDRGAIGSQAPKPKAAQEQPWDKDPITDKQRTRLHTIAQRADRPPEVIKAWLKEKYGYSSSKEIAKGKYDEICKLIESEAPLMNVAGREPGDED